MAAPVYVTGDRKPAMFAVDSSTVIAKGDLVYLDTDDVKPLTSLSDSGTKAQNQAAARDVFTGVALKASPNGATLPIPVALAGVFEFDCASGTFEIGDKIGPQGTGTASAVGVSATAVESVTADKAIGRVFKRVSVADTRVQVEIFTVSSARPQDDSAAFDTISELTAASGVTIDSVLLKDAGIVATGTLQHGAANADRVAIKGQYLSDVFAVAVPTIANDAAENADSVAVDVSSMTFAPAVGDLVIALPLEALPTDCLLCGAYVTNTDQVTVTFASKEAGGGVTGANKNFKFFFMDLT